MSDKTTDRTPLLHSAEILSVGTELLLGEIVDTNSAYIAADLATRGVNVYWSQRVGDNLERIAHGIKQALSRSDLLILSGGLGPTDDDMTREAIAKVLGETPEIDKSLEHDLREKFAKFSRRMPEKNLKQAWLIPSARTLPNPVGTAPGWFVRTVVAGKDRVLVTLPGPPRELKRMWHEEVLPRLALPQSALFSRTFKTLGIGESSLAEKLGDLTLHANPSVATYAKRDGVHVRVAAKADTDEQSLALAKPIVEQVEGLLSGMIWGYDQDELVTLILQKLAKQGLGLATLESFTGGALATEFSSVSEIGAKYKGSVVLYNMQAYPALTLPQGFFGHETPSEKDVLEAADAVKTLFHADLGLAVHGVKEDAPTQDIVFAVSGALNASKRIRLPHYGASWMRERASYAALSLLWSQLNA